MLDISKIDESGCICARCRSVVAGSEMDPRGADADYPIGYKVQYYGGAMCVACCASEEQEHVEMRAAVDLINSGATRCATCRGTGLVSMRYYGTGSVRDICSCKVMA